MGVSTNTGQKKMPPGWCVTNTVWKSMNLLNFGDFFKQQSLEALFKVFDVDNSRKWFHVKYDWQKKFLKFHTVVSAAEAAQMTQDVVSTL